MQIACLKPHVSMVIFQVGKYRKPDSKRFRREGDTEDKRPLFRSTMFPPDKSLIKGSCIKELADEMLGIVKL